MRGEKKRTTNSPVYSHSLASLKDHSQSMHSFSKGWGQRIHLRTCVNFSVVVDNTTLDIIRPRSRDHAGGGFFRLEVLDIRFTARVWPIRTQHLLQLINLKTAPRSVCGLRALSRNIFLPVTGPRLTAWMYRTPYTR